jgi:hypothetical protein
METKADHMTEEEKKLLYKISQLLLLSMRKLMLINQLLYFYVNIFIRIQHWHWCNTIVVQQILMLEFFNNKLKSDVETSVLWDCISNLIGSPIGQEESMLCQETFNNLDQPRARIATCASCCDRLWSADGQRGLVEMKIEIDDFSSEFLLKELQIECMTTLPHNIVEKNYQVVKHNGFNYHLNPGLMLDINQIVLCCVCVENSITKDQESIAAGSDYGRLGNLKPLNGTPQNACIPVQLYNISLQIQANHSTNHSIAFPMNGPVERLKKLPCIDERYWPQVTFL